MKRKRPDRGSQSAVKKQKLDQGHQERPSHTLLRKYYPELVTLRQYLASRLNKKRRRRLQLYGRDDTAPGDPDVRRLLDSTMIGTFAAVHVQDESLIEDDISIFTQQLSGSTAPPTPGGLKQHEIVDFAIWLLFRRQQGSTRPSHLLCQTYQRYLNANNHGVEPQIVPGIPGIYASGTNDNANALRHHPWTAIPELLGGGGDRILGDLLLECGIFQPIAGSNNLSQLSGIPMCDLDLLPCAPVSSDAPRTTRPSNMARVPAERDIRSVTSPSNIRFVRHRMLYARPALTSKGKVKFGLNQIHVFNRQRDLDDQEQTKHVMKYVFPRQFGLHNVFTSELDSKETAQACKDYTLREKEILHQKWVHSQRSKAKGIDASLKTQRLPPRLRGKTFELVRRMRKRHSRCAFSALLDHYCPVTHPQEAFEHDSFARATHPAQVSAFCRSAISKVFPPELWGDSNVRHLHGSIDNFIKLRRYESLALHDILQRIKVTDVEWLSPPGIDATHKLCPSDYAKRKELMAELLYYLFDSFLVPLIRGHFHVTESSMPRNQLFYFRHDVWKEMSEPALNSLKLNMLEECNTTTVKTMLAKRSLGVSHVRLLPKEQGMRPIINLRRRVQKLQQGQIVLGRSINSALTPTFSTLNYEKSANSTLLGSALFSVDDMFPRLQAYREDLARQGLSGKPLYFAKVDVQACFDTIPQARLMQMARKIIAADQYQIARYSRAKLAETITPRAKPSWKFLTKATPGTSAFDFRREIERDTAEGRTRTVYVNGGNARQESRRAILSLLEEHIESNLIKVGNRFYRQKIGIPQGSIVSSLLCSYFYAELERHVLSFVGGNSILLRLIDDFLIISTDRGVAEKFVRTMHAGVPEYGVQIKADKSRANFDVEVNGKKIMKVADADFPYCGNAINTVTLDLSKDRERRRQANSEDSITVEYSKLPGQTFYRKTLNALKLQMHAMLLSTTYNTIPTVMSNLHHCFLEVAQKSYHYIRSLPSERQPAGQFIIRAVDDVIKLSCVLMRQSKLKGGKEASSFECCITPGQARWLACTAFDEVFRRRQTRYTTLLAWLQAQRTAATDKISRTEAIMLSEAVARSGGSGPGCVVSRLRTA
ncbi:telomerase reverse transcriptase like protein [Zymoseptoria brevis]|uniref:Telomerase reverse transcriptase n=1 Tax=Zymoseptoria brevis TaxID=1047168 RepID=A0A0F4GDV7_9PEZI|nr:telomerase reverse transcriptase like protein [Zymoseptoria brevis]